MTASHVCTEGFGLKGCVNAEHLVAESLTENRARIPEDVMQAALQVTHNALRTQIAADPDGYRERAISRGKKAGAVTANIQRVCDDCGYSGWPGVMARHLKSKGHSGYTQL
jgi:hypothetical protein